MMTRGLIPWMFLVACSHFEPSSPTSAVAGAEPAITLNRALLSMAEAEDGFLTLKGVRAAAMMHLAMHDALNAVAPRYQRYAFFDEVPDADPVVAAIHAAATVARAQFGDRVPAGVAPFDGRRAGLSPEVEAASLRLGEAVARAVIAKRKDDGWDGQASYTWHPMAPGVYAEFREHSGTPEGFVFGAGWAKASPFMLGRPDRFRSPAPPPIESQAYTRAFNEVKSVGAHDSPTRTPDQTHLALWWKDFAENSHNRLARKLARAERLDLWDASRLFALLNMSVFDAYVSVFYNKFHFNHWRPYTAIRWAAKDGNPDTVPDPAWTNTHHHTYAFPSYPSAHGCACAAAMKVVADVFGAATPFTMDTPVVDRAGPMSEKMRMDPPFRRFDTPADAAWECAMSRVYLGIHFRYDSIQGNRLGAKIGDFATQNFLRPITAPAPVTRRRESSFRYPR